MLLKSPIEEYRVRQAERLVRAFRQSQAFQQDCARELAGCLGCSEGEAWEFLDRYQDVSYVLERCGVEVVPEEEVVSIPIEPVRGVDWELALIWSLCASGAGAIVIMAAMAWW